MLNKEQFEEIKEALADYRFRRGLFYENQRKGFLGNIFEEISEYLRAENDTDRAEELCDMAIFLINAFDFEYDVGWFNRDRKINMAFIIQNITDYFISFNRLATDDDDTIFLKRNIDKRNLNLMLFELNIMIEDSGFDFYKCLKEKIKAINSRSGKWDEASNKWVKDTSPEAVAKWYSPDFSKCKFYERSKK